MYEKVKLEKKKYYTQIQRNTLKIISKYEIKKPAIKYDGLFYIRDKILVLFLFLIRRLFRCRIFFSCRSFRCRCFRSIYFYLFRRVYFFSNFYFSCFFCRFLSTTASASSFFLVLSDLTINLIIVYQLDERHFRVVTKTIFKLDNTCIPTWTRSNFFRNFAEQNRDSFFVFQVCKNCTTRVRCIVL